MKKTLPFIFIVVALALTLVATANAGSVVIDSSSQLTSVTIAISTNKRGIVFTTGPNGPYTINDLKVKFAVSVLGDYTFTAGIYDVNSNLPNSLKVSATLPINAASTGSQLFDFNSAVLNSLGTYSLANSTQYALIFYGMNSNNVQLARNGQGVLSYAVSDGFSVNNSVVNRC